MSTWTPAAAMAKCQAEARAAGRLFTVAEPALSAADAVNVARSRARWSATAAQERADAAAAAREAGRDRAAELDEGRARLHRRSAVAWREIAAVVAPGVLVGSGG